MDVREKQIEELAQVIAYSCIDLVESSCGEGECCVSCLATKLYNNGVTVQEWHSVNECMPEDLEENKGKKVINCIVEHDPYGNGKTTAQFRQRKYNKYSDNWYWSKIGSCTVTRWTMMPKPPKGE